MQGPRALVSLAWFTAEDPSTSLREGLVPLPVDRAEVNPARTQVPSRSPSSAPGTWARSLPPLASLAPRSRAWTRTGDDRFAPPR
jgi:hypothetical protein